MIVEYLRYAIAADRAEAFIADYEAASAPLLAAPWCLSFDLCRCVEEPSSFILRIEWTSAEDHLGEFRGSPEFRAFFGKIRPYLRDIAEMRHYERLLPRAAEAAPDARG